MRQKKKADTVSKQSISGPGLGFLFLVANRQANSPDNTIYNYFELDIAMLSYVCNVSTACHTPWGVVARFFSMPKVLRFSALKLCPLEPAARNLAAISIIP